MYAGGSVVWVMESHGLGYKSRLFSKFKNVCKKPLLLGKESRIERGL